MKKSEKIILAIVIILSHGNFPKSSTRWKNFTCGESNTHISVYNFDTCDDKNLVLIFEKIVRTHYKQM